MNQEPQIRRGSAIATVICFVALLMVLITSLVKTTTENRFAVFKGLPPLQAKLIALSGVHHMLLKAKIMPTEFYDAWCLSKGRNPLYNFAKDVDPVKNPGPRFISRGSQDSTDPLQRLSVLDTVDTSYTDSNRNPSWFANDLFAGKTWPKWGNGNFVLNSDLYMWKFIADVTNKANIQPALLIASATDGFAGTYEVASLTILGQRDNTGYYEDTIYFEVSGRIIDGFGFDCTETVNSTVYVKRR